MTPTLTPEALAHTDALLARLQGVGHLTADQLESWWASRRGVRRVELFRLLRHLVDDGRVVALSGRRWGLPSTTPPKAAAVTSAAVAPPAKVMDLPAGARLACVEPGVPPRVTIEMGSGGDTVKIIGAPARVAAMADAYQRQVAAEVEATRKATPPEPSSTTAAPRPVAAPREEPVAVAGGELLTLSDAIAHAEEKGAGEGGCAANHRQLAGWLRQLEESEKGCADLVREVVALRTRHDDTRLRFCSALNLSAQTEWNEILDRVRHQRDALATCARERDEAARRLATRTAERDEAIRERDDLIRLLETPPAPAPRPRPTTAAKPTPKTDPRKVPAPGTVAARILASLRRGPKDTATLQARLDLPAPTVRGRLSELATGGWVAKGLNGAWEVIG